MGRTHYRSEIQTHEAEPLTHALSHDFHHIHDISGIKGDLRAGEVAQSVTCSLHRQEFCSPVPRHSSDRLRSLSTGEAEMGERQREPEAHRIARLSNQRALGSVREPDSKIRGGE